MHSEEAIPIISKILGLDFKEWPIIEDESKYERLELSEISYTHNISDFDGLVLVAINIRRPTDREIESYEYKSTFDYDITHEMLDEIKHKTGFYVYEMSIYNGGKHGETGIFCEIVFTNGRY